MLFNLHDFIAGWVGGISGLVVGHPLDTIKTRQQTYSTPMWIALQRTYRHEGIHGFYKGMLFPLLATGPSNSVFFGVYGNSLQNFQQINDTKVSIDDPHWMHKVFYAGCIGGFATVMVTCPVELVKTVLQANIAEKGNWNAPYTSLRQERGMIECMRNIYRHGGIAGFYRGLMPMLYRDVPSYGLYTLAYEVLMHHCFHPDFCGEIWRQVYSGGFAGVLSWMFIIPFDVIKSRMQADNREKPRYKGMMDCIYKTYKTEGLSMFNKGFLVVCVRAFPVNAATFVAYEAVLKLLREYF